MAGADVVIAGAGVAGMAAALTARRLGASVLLLGPAPDGQDRPGESLSASALSVLEAIGCDDIVRGAPHRPSMVIYSAWGLPVLAQRHAAGHPEGAGFVLDRPAFEQALAARVIASGVAWRPEPAVQAQADGGRWRVDVASGARLEASFLIDATGRAATLARTRARRFRADRLVAAWTMMARTDAELEPTAASLIEAAPSGWWYASLLPDERLSLAFFSDPDLLPRGLSRDLGRWRQMAEGTLFIRRWLETATFPLDAPPRLASAATTWLAPAAHGEAGASGPSGHAPAWAAVGDAACALDPLSSHGLATALWTGHRAARAGLAHLDGDSTALTAYAQTLAEAVTQFLADRANVYGSERRWRDLPFWERRRMPERP